MKSLLGKLIFGVGARNDPHSLPASIVRNESVERYFALHERIRASKKAGDYVAAAAHAKASVPLFSELVADSLRAYGRWDIRSSVAVTEGGAVLMALGDHDGLAAMHTALKGVPQLAEWAEEISSRRALAHLGDRIVELLTERGEQAQTTAREALAFKDGRDFSNVCVWLEKVGRIELTKRGKTYWLRASGI